MGRTKTPNAILKARGSRNFRDLEPEFEPGFGKAPDILSGRALEVWNDIVDFLDGEGIGSRIDGYGLVQLCQAVQEAEDATRMIEKIGLLAKTERGITKNPAIMVRNSAAMRIKAFAAEFGITPASRGKLKLLPEKAENEFDRFG